MGDVRHAGAPIGSAGQRHGQHAVADQHRHRFEMPAGSADADTGMHDVEAGVAPRAAQHVARQAGRPGQRLGAAGQRSR